MIKNNITTSEQLEGIKKESFNQPQLIYKHSTTCSLSEMIWNELQKSNFTIQFIDLLAHRDISNQIERDYSVRHESPQVLVIMDGVCVYNESHFRIKNEIVQQHLM